MKGSAIIKIILRIFGVAGIIALVWSWKTFGSYVMAANSVKQLNDNFYYMEYKGDYQLEEFLAKGGAESNKQMAVYIENILKGKRVNKVYKNVVPLNTGCASVGINTMDGKRVFGRNYDWNKDDFKCGMIIKTTPKKGYKSISTTQLDFLGFGENFKPDSFANKYLSAAGIFVPLDGMNEKGLCISDLMAGDEEVTDQSRGNVDVTTTLAIRGILDFCADVAEALKFLENCDMHSVIGYAHHFAISDAAGRMVVVEFINNKMIVTEANAVTNHYLCDDEREVENMENSKLRLEVLNNRILEKGTMEEADVAQVLYDIHASQYGKDSKTWWRGVFNQTDLTVQYALAENYMENALLNFKL